MARPPQDAIETFISITGTSEVAAIQKLEEHGGDLNEAINAHFSEGDRGSEPAPRDDFMNIDDPIVAEPQRPTFPLMPTGRNVNPFSLLDPNFGDFFNRTTDFPGLAPRVSHPREVRVIPIDLKDGNNRPHSSGHRPTVEEVTGNLTVHGPEVHGTVTIEDDEDEDMPSAPGDLGASHMQVQNSASGDIERHSRPSLTSSIGATDYNNDIEEEMIRAAIEASRREAEGYPSQQLDIPKHTSGSQSEQSSAAFEDVDLAHAVSLSLKTAEHERALREQEVQIQKAQLSNSSGFKPEKLEQGTSANGRPSGPSNSGDKNFSVQEEAEDVEEQPLVRHRSRRFGIGNAESVIMINSPPSSPNQVDIAVAPPHNGNTFPSDADEWGGLSSEEHDEAVMLEAAMFGGVPEGTGYRFQYPPHQTLQTNSSAFYPQVPRPISPTLTAQRLIREQQDDEYLASLQADREKELKAMEEAERHRLEEAAARETALRREKHQEEENHRKQLEEKELMSKLAAKEASLPPEPSSDDENAVTLLVRMPDGSRHGRRFLKSDRLKFLFDYIDIARIVKPGTYRLVRPFPRRAFTDMESEMTLSELGLTSKQEALFLELV